MLYHTWGRAINQFKSIFLKDFNDFLRDFNYVCFFKLSNNVRQGANFSNICKLLKLYANSLKAVCLIWIHLVMKVEQCFCFLLIRNYKLKNFFISIIHDLFFVNNRIPQSLFIYHLKSCIQKTIQMSPQFKINFKRLWCCGVLMSWSVDRCGTILHSFVCKV